MAKTAFRPPMRLGVRPGPRDIGHDSPIENPRFPGCRGFLGSHPAVCHGRRRWLRHDSISPGESHDALRLTALLAPHDHASGTVSCLRRPGRPAFDREIRRRRFPGSANGSTALREALWIAYGRPLKAGTLRRSTRPCAFQGGCRTRYASVSSPEGRCIHVGSMLKY